MKATWSICLLFSLFACACSSNSSDAGPAPTPAPISNATVNIVTPTDNQSFPTTPTSYDIAVSISETNFTRVLFGMEGSDLSKGQVRLYVDGTTCNDPGEAPKPAEPYNAILPNDKNESSIGLDYCPGGTFALDNMDHTLKAQLWHGDTPLVDAAGNEIFDMVTFHTTYSDIGSAGAGSN